MNTTTGRKIKRGRGSRTRAGDSASRMAEEELEGHMASTIRLGDVDMYGILVGLEFVLRGQTEALKAFLQLPDEFEDRVKRIWYALISTLPIQYDEETFQPTLPESAPVSTNPVSPVIPADINFWFESAGEEEESDKEAEQDPNSAPHSTTSTPVLPSLKGRRLLKMPTSMALLLVLYFALVELNVPILLADIRRLVMIAVIPLENLQYLIPPSVLRIIERHKLDHLFMGRRWASPNMRAMQRLSLVMARQLAGQVTIFIHPLNLAGLVERLVRELSLPGTS